MENFYFDTSALIKRYFGEDGSEKIQNIFSQSPYIITSILTYPEVYSTIHRLHREGFLTKKQLKLICLQFERDWKEFTVVECNDKLCDLIQKLIERFPLRGADLVQLSSAVKCHEHGIKLKFVSSDQRLINAADEYGFSTLNPG